MKKINLIYGFLTGLIILFYCSNAGAAQVNEEKVLIRISYQSKAEERRVKALNLDIVEEKPGEYIETKLTWEEIIKLHARNFDLSYVIEIEFPPIDSTYHSPSEIQSTLFNLASEYASIVSLDTIGRSTRYNRPIWAVKISDNPHLDEDESRILLTGAHHAREPLSTEVCLYLIKKFCNNYHQDQKIFHWINETEIWIVPVVNPDGYALIFDPTHNLRWWRKNLRDNNGNGLFEPDCDGVDLNRNYDFNWHSGGSLELDSQYYRGPAPFSEQEIQALKQLAENKRFAVIIDFHSFGEAVLYPWGNFEDPPDLQLITELAAGMATQIRKTDGSGCYDIIPLDAQMGQSSVWYYGRLGILGFIVEVGETYFPPGDQIPPIVENNSRAVEYILERLHGACLTGHVYDLHSRQPVTARIEIEGLESNVLNNYLVTESLWGRFDRILPAGVYTIRFRAEGYHPKVIKNVIISEDRPTRLTVYLLPEYVNKPPGND